MGRIQSSVGLVTGVAIEDTVNQLMQLNAIPRDRLESRNQILQREQVAVTELMTLVVGVELTAERLGQDSLYRAATAKSSNSDALSVRNTGSPKVGSYSFQPIRTAQSQQLTSSMFASKDQKVGAGEVVIRTGGFLDSSVSLDGLNGGSGVARGKINITDRSGNSAEIDLRFAQSASDVVDAINANASLGVVAAVDGDTFRLTDVTGQTTANLQVSEVAGGTTAADLGLASINVAANNANGSSVQSISSSTSLRSLLDGRGLDLPATGDALELTLSDGSAVSINLELDNNSASLGELVDAINTAGGGDVGARISANGKSLEIEDLSGGAGTFSISSPSGSLAEQLGLDNAAVGGTITGDRLISGLSDTLLSSLGGGSGLGTLGDITITDRNGTSDTINLSSAETLEDVLDAINASSANVTAQLNSDKSGIEIVDNTGSTASDLIIADADATNSATALKIVGTVSDSSLGGESLDKQFVSRNTRLEDFNQGRGVNLGRFTIVDSQGSTSDVNLASGGIETIGDVIDRINAAGVSVTAAINDTGDGIVITDDAGGTGTLSITDTAGGNTAAELGIAGTGGSITAGGNAAIGIDGSRTLRITTTADTTIEQLADEINGLTSTPLNANILNLDSAGGVRLMLSGTSTGSQGRVTVSSDLNLGLSQTAAARDALLAFGSSEDSGGVVVASSTNTFTGLVDDLEFTVNEASDTPIAITVEENQGNISKQVEAFVEQYNKVRDKLDEVTAFDAVTQSVGILFGKSSALRVDFAFGRLVSGSVRGVGDVSSLAQVGVDIGENGKLSFSQSKFDAAYDRDPSAVEEFFKGREVFDEARYNQALLTNPDADKAEFTSTTSGFSQLAKDVTDSLAGVERGALLTRSETLNSQIDQNRDRIEALSTRLDKQRTRLLTQFYNMEQVISRLQQNLTALNGLQTIPAGSVNLGQ
ncbi:MAG TPA: hypothetical protein DDW52_09210 [Planctomycetaceae bacterium]|nr:hypothetical protein [Planctomycetaceae bacterium]